MYSIMAYHVFVIGYDEEYYIIRSDEKMQYVIKECVASGLSQSRLWDAYEYCDEDVVIDKAKKYAKFVFSME